MNSVSKSDMIFFARNYDFINKVEDAGLDISYTIRGAVDADWASGSNNGRGTRYVMKHLFDETDYFFRLFSKFKELVNQEKAVNEKTDWIHSIIHTIDSLLEVKQASKSDYENQSYCIKISESGRTLATIVGNKKQELVNMLLRSYESVSSD